MNKINKKTPFLMMLVLSLVASQLFFKAIGINPTPSFGTIVHTFGKAANLLDLVYQPGFLAELGVLSNHLLCTQNQNSVDGEKLNGHLACNQTKEFDFEMPPTIEIREPEYGDKAGKACCWKSLTHNRISREKTPGVEVLELAADVEDETPILESDEEVSTGFLVPAVAASDAPNDSPEAEGKATSFAFENGIMTSGVKVQSALKLEKIKMPCPNQQEQLRKDALRRLEESQNMFEEFKENCDLSIYQALRAEKKLEKGKRFRVIVKLAPQGLPRTLVNGPDLVVGPEESEF